MQKSLIDFYLGKVAAGDLSFVDKLCEQLSDRLVYVPLTAPVKSASGTTKVSILRFTVEGRASVLAFTSERTFKQWVTNTQSTHESFTLLGGDLCSMLSNDSWLVIDEGDSHRVQLSPAQVKKVAASGLIAEPPPEEPITEAPAPQNMRPAPPISSAVKTVQREPSEVESTYIQKPRVPSEDATEVKSPASANGASHRVPNTAATQVGRLILSPKSPPSANLQSSISAVPDEKASEPKKKSFLSFLKTAR